METEKKMFFVDKTTKIPCPTDENTKSMCTIVDKDHLHVAQYYEINSMTVNEAVEKMEEHTRDNPTHGTECACKDKWITAARNALGGYQKGSDNARYLIHALARSL